MMNRTICVLGCGGFIGSHVLERILSTTSWHVLGIDVDSAKIDHLLAHPRLSFVTLDVHESREVRACVERSDIVISLVALCNPSQYNTIPLEVIDINFTRPRELVEMCGELNKWLIHFSTSEVYGKTAAAVGSGENRYEDPSRYVLSEDSSPLILGPIRAQRWSYAAAKQLLERVIFGYAHARGLQYTIVRPFNFIGPRMDFIPGIDGSGTPRVIACFMEALLRGKPLKLVDGGANRRVFTYIGDAVDALMRMLHNPESARGHIFNIGNPHNEVSIADLARMMIHAYQALNNTTDTGKIEVRSVSSEEFYGEGYEDSDRRVPDISKARSLLQWEPRTSLEEAVRTTVSSYVTHYAGAVTH